MRDKRDMREKFAKGLDHQEIRCPSCGKLLLKGRFTGGSELFLRCRGKCVYHKKDLVITFIN